MKLTLVRRSLVFATFFGACLVLALVAGALGTPHWVDARAVRTSNPAQSVGRVEFGLFEGVKELNVGAGSRTRDFSVRTGWHPARRWAWCGCAALLAAAAAAAAGAAALAVVAAAAGRRAAVAPLLLTNLLAAFLCAGALCVWAAEFSLRLSDNVLPPDDLANTWSSAGLASLGHSYWLVLAAALVAASNAGCVCAASRAPPAPPPDKLHPAIMLY